MLVNEAALLEKAGELAAQIADCPESYEWVLLGMIGRRLRENGHTKLGGYFSVASNACLQEGTLIVRMPPRRGTMNYAAAHKAAVAAEAGELNRKVPRPKVE